jgi:hypothetical protein
VNVPTYRNDIQGDGNANYSILIITHCTHGVNDNSAPCKKVQISYVSLIWGPVLGENVPRTGKFSQLSEGKQSLCWFLPTLANF